MAEGTIIISYLGPCGSDLPTLCAGLVADRTHRAVTWHPMTRDISQIVPSFWKHNAINRIYTVCTRTWLYRLSLKRISSIWSLDSILHSHRLDRSGRFDIKFCKFWFHSGLLHVLVLTTSIIFERTLFAVDHKHLQASITYDLSCSATLMQQYIQEGGYNVTSWNPGHDVTDLPSSDIFGALHRYADMKWMKFSLNLIETRWPLLCNY